MHCALRCVSTDRCLLCRCLSTEWPPWPISQLDEVQYSYKVHMVARDEEKTKVTDRISRTDWMPRYNPHAATCGRCLERVNDGQHHVAGDGSCLERNPIGNETHPGPGCIEYFHYETMNERHGIVVYFGQKGNLGSTANWLTLLVASFATIAVLNSKINQMVTGVATDQLAYTGAVFLTKPVDDYKLSNWDMLKETFPMLSYMFIPSNIWAYVSGMACFQVRPGRKEICESTATPHPHNLAQHF